MEKSEFRVLIKRCFLMGKHTVQAKHIYIYYITLTSRSMKIARVIIFIIFGGIRKEKRDRTCLALPFMVPGEVCPGRIAWVVLIG